MSKPVKIDFVSDVACPWCAIGLASLERAIAAIGGDLQVELHFQPFELNPDMGPDGESIADHLGRKYGLSPEQLAQNGEALRLRGEALGFHFDLRKRDRIYNTFDAHRLLYWAGELGGTQQHALKRALLQAYHGEGRNVSDRDTLVAIASAAGLDATGARGVLETDRFAAEVRERERFYQQHGIQAVPSVILNDRHLVQGGQPPETFEQALRQLSGITA
ncbi:Predicted dithiol-disulfide isomerase, DsbA family [Pseudoxanthomonas sp. CF385]|uniref:DsbA family oxidoreductase n=1 Tax=Pseudoxanthomonas sp. CF385 TaxID=1881042 RepID=UPI00087FB656|nr:DsbA family oxidoreductase [Pseudoxanthomonas sp. CF385]SDR19174.1 Predicted dithiol-disulfide isomerase, DsbA family [Pseudoxanthomonas sp. CF385]